MARLAKESSRTINRAVCIFLCFIMMASVLLTSCTVRGREEPEDSDLSVETGDDDKKNGNKPERTKEYRAYINDEYGISFDRPSGWSELDTDSKVATFMINEKYGSTFDISATNIGEADLPMSQYMDATISSLEGALNEFSLVDTGDLSIDGNDAGYVIYTSESGEGMKLKSNQMLTIVNGTAFTFSFITGSRGYNRYEEEVMDLIKTVAFDYSKQNIEDEDEVNPNSYTTEFIPYLNDLYGISFEVPSEWDEVENIATSVTYVIDEKHFSGVNFSVGILENDGSPVSHYMYEIVYNLEEMGHVVIDKGEMSVDGKEAFYLKYRGLAEGVMNTVHQVMVLYNDTLYAFTYSSLPEGFDLYDEAFMDMVGTVDIEEQGIGVSSFVPYNNEEYGIYFQVPWDWEKIEIEGTLAVYKIDENHMCSLNVVATDLGVSGFSVSQMLDGVIMSLEQTVEGFALIDKGTSFIDGKDALYVIYNMDKDGMEMKVIQVMVIKDSTAIAITFSSDIEGYDKYSADLENLLTTIEIK